MCFQIISSGGHGPDSGEDENVRAEDRRAPPGLCSFNNKGLIRQSQDVIIRQTLYLGKVSGKVPNKSFSLGEFLNNHLPSQRAGENFICIARGSPVFL